MHASAFFGPLLRITILGLPSLANYGLFFIIVWATDKKTAAMPFGPLYLSPDASKQIDQKRDGK